MLNSVFTYDHYLTFLKDFLSSKGNEWGIKSKLSSAIEIHGTYLTQVLKGEKELTLEQIERFGRYLSLTESEMRYLILLHQENRAGSVELRGIMNKQRVALRKEFSDVSRRLGKKQDLSEVAQMTFYSHWSYAALQVGAQVKGLRSARAAAKRFGLSDQQALYVFEFLMNIGLVQKKGPEFLPTGNWIRLSGDSPMLSQHHSNVRLKALQAVLEKREEDFHYSGYFSFSKTDLPKLKEIWLKAIREFQKDIEPSPSEEVYGLALDLFKI